MYVQIDTEHTDSNIACMEGGGSAIIMCMWVLATQPYTHMYCTVHVSGPAVRSASMYIVRRCYMSIALYVCCECKCVYTLMCNMTIL